MNDGGSLEGQHIAEAEVDLEPIGSEAEDVNAGPTRYELFTYPADFTLEVLHQKWRNREIVIPEIQRLFVWTQSQASKLIESFLLGLPVPPIFLYSEKGSEKLLVVDGQQRLRTIFYFLEETFGEEVAGKRMVFRLKLTEGGKWDNRAFSDLTEEDARKLKNAVLRSFIMKQVSPEDDTSIYHVFERLNTGGTLLTTQEVRNCVYSGPFNQLLHELNKLPSWRQILGKEKPDLRLRDVELILRFLALLKSVDKYQKPMKDFLTHFMRLHRDGGRSEEFRAIFTQVSDQVRRVLGEKPFHIRAGLNAAVFDAVFVAFAGATERPEDIGGRYKKLVEDEEFRRITSSGTTAVESVRGRIRMAGEYLFG